MTTPLIVDNLDFINVYLQSKTKPKIEPTPIMIVGTPHTITKGELMPCTGVPTILIAPPVETDELRFADIAKLIDLVCTPSTHDLL